MKTFHIAACVLLLMLASCSSAASGSEAESADLATPTEATSANTQTAVETGTPAGPAATQTAISLELEVVESYSWTDERGFSWVEALVRNPYEYPVEIYEPTVRLLDSAGEIVVRIDEVYYLTGSGRGGLGQIL